MTSSFSSSPVITRSWKKDKNWIYIAKNKPSKRKICLCLGKKQKQNEHVSEQLYALQRHKRLPRSNSYSFLPLEDSKWYEVFPIESALTMEGKQDIMHGQRHSEVSKPLCGCTIHYSPGNHISGTVQGLCCNQARSLGMGVCCMLPAFDHCRLAVSAKPEQRDRADLDQSLGGQLQTEIRIMRIWGIFDLFFFKRRNQANKTSS